MSAEDEDTPLPRPTPGPYEPEIRAVQNLALATAELSNQLASIAASMRAVGLAPEGRALIAGGLHRYAALVERTAAIVEGQG